jgi:hypothetical protein
MITTSQCAISYLSSESASPGCRWIPTPNCPNGETIGTAPTPVTHSSRIRGSTASTSDPRLVRSYFGGWSPRTAVRTVFRETPSTGAICLIEIPSVRCSRPISAQSSTDNTSARRGPARGAVGAHRGPRRRSGRRTCCHWSGVMAVTGRDVRVTGVRRVFWAIPRTPQRHPPVRSHPCRTHPDPVPPSR